MLGWCICLRRVVLGITPHAWCQQILAGAESLAPAYLCEAAMIPHNVDVVKLCQQGHLQTVCRALLCLPAAGWRKTRHTHCFSVMKQASHHVH